MHGPGASTPPGKGVGPAFPPRQLQARFRWPVPQSSSPHPWGEPAASCQVPSQSHAVKKPLSPQDWQGWQDTSPLKEACRPQPGLSSLSAEGTVGSTPRAWQGVGRRPWKGSCRDFQGWAPQGPLGRVQRWSSTCREGGRDRRAQPQCGNARSLWVAGVPCSHVTLGKLSMSPG